MTDTWEVTGDTITPEMLRADPDKFGGAGIHMMMSVAARVFSVQVRDGCTYVSLPVSQENAERILKDGGGGY